MISVFDLSFEQLRWQPADTLPANEQIVLVVLDATKSEPVYGWNFGKPVCVTCHSCGVKDTLHAHVLPRDWVVKWMPVPKPPPVPS